MTRKTEKTDSILKLRRCPDSGVSHTNNKQITFFLNAHYFIFESHTAVLQNVTQNEQRGNLSDTSLSKAKAKHYLLSKCK